MTLRRAGLVLAWATIALAVPSSARAEPRLAGTEVSSEAVDAGRGERAPLDLEVNGQKRDAVLVVLRPGDALVPVEDLELAGLRGFAGRREVVEGRLHVSLASLAPALRFEVDEVGLALRVTAPPELLGRAVLDLRRSTRPQALEPRADPSVFLNYSVSHHLDGRGDGQTSAAFEAGASQAGRLLFSSGQLLPGGTAVRGLTSLTLDDPGRLRRVVLGDAVATSTGLGGGVLLGGLTVAREWRLDPYFVRSPLPRTSGFAATPSTLDVYVNGILQRQLQLAPGSFDLLNLPVSAGAGNVQTVLRDAFGRTETFSWRYYYTATLLDRGLTDYAYTVGFRRIGLGRESFEYGRPVGVGRHRVGLRDGLTVGGRLDAAQDLVSGGPSVTLGLPFGTLDLEAAASGEGGATGAAGSIGYSFTAPRLGAGTLVRLQSDSYANAALRATDDRARLQWTLFAGAQLLPRLGVSTNYDLALRRDADATETVSVRTDVRLSRELHLGLSGARTRVARAASYGAFATLSWSFAPLTTADVSLQAGDGGEHGSVGVQRSLPVGTGFGYRARAATGPVSRNGTALAEAQWEHGRYSAQYDRVGAVETGTATAAGSIVLLGGSAFLSRPLQDGFALVRVGVPGVRTYAEGQEIGVTDAQGELLVPNLLSYYGNRLGIADRDVPPEHQVGQTELLAAPTFRGGLVAPFAVTRMRAAQGVLVTTGDVVPAYGDLAVRAGERDVTSPVGGDGAFFLEGLPAGTYAGVVEWSKGRCRAVLEVPAEPPIVDLGRVPCVAEGVAGAPGPQLDVEPALATTDAAAELAPELVATTAPSQPEAEPEVVATAVAAAPEPELASSTEPAAAEPSLAATTAGPAPRANPPPPAGYGPRTARCPSCAVCFHAEPERVHTPTAQLRCIEDLTILMPQVGRAAAERACLVTPSWTALCDDCLRLRSDRRCPTWPEAPRGVP